MLKVFNTKWNKHVVFKGMFEELSVPTTGRREMCEEFSSALLF